MGDRQLSDDGQQRDANAGRKAADAYGANRFGIWIEVESCSVNSGQNGDGVIGQPTPGRG
jgi:hypothetical protein